MPLTVCYMVCATFIHYGWIPRDTGAVKGVMGWNHFSTRATIYLSPQLLYASAVAQDARYDGRARVFTHNGIKN